MYRDYNKTQLTLPMETSVIILPINDCTLMLLLYD